MDNSALDFPKTDRDCFLLIFVNYLDLRSAGLSYRRISMEIESGDSIFRKLDRFSQSSYRCLGVDWLIVRNRLAVVVVCGNGNTHVALAIGRY